MGVVKLSRIPVWDPQSQDPDASGPVAGYSATDRVTLTKVLITDSMGVDYGDEQGGFELWKGRPLEVRTAGTPIREALRLTTIEISTDNRARVHHTAVIGFRPASMDWFGWSRFKTVTKDAKRKLQKLVEAVAASPFSKEAALWSALSDMNTDPFGNEDTLYARFRQLERTDSLADPERYYDEDDRISVSGSKANRKTADPEITLGICERFDDCRAALKISDYLREVLERAGDGEARNHDGSLLHLCRTAQSLAGELMEAAMVQALSGPGRKELASLRKDEETAKWGAAAVLARRVFEDSLRNLHKRTENGESRIFLEEMPATETAGSAERPEMASLTLEEIEARIAHQIEKLQGRRTGIDSTLWPLIIQILRTELDEPSVLGERSSHRTNVEDACIRAASLARFLPMPDSAIEVLNRLRPNYPLFVTAALGLEFE